MVGRIKSLGSSLAHGVAKRELREKGDVFYRKLRECFSSAELGKQSRTARFNRVSRCIEKKFSKELLCRATMRKGKKKIHWFVLANHMEDIGVSMTSIMLPFAAISDVELNAEYLIITPHALARLYQTYGVRSISEFIDAHSELFWGIFSFAVMRTHNIQSGPPDDDFYKMSLWDKTAEFRCIYDVNGFFLETVISTESMAPVKVIKARQDAISESGSDLWLPDWMKSSQSIFKGMKLYF